MTRARLLLVPAAVLLTAAGASGLPLPAAVVVGGVIGGLTAVGLWALHARQLDRLAEHINRWLARPHPEPVTVPPRDPAWQHLGVALNALATSYGRRGRRLTHARQLRTELVEAMRDPALLFDADGYLVCANPASRRHFRLPAGEQLTVAQTLGSAELAGAVAEARAAEVSVELEAPLGEREYAAAAVPVGREVLLLLRDTSARRRVDAVRRDFVANASHELKTPVSGIQSLAGALTVMVERDPERARSLAGRLEEEADRLGKLVHDLLDLRRLEDDGEDKTESVDLAEVIRREAERVTSVADERDITLAVDAPRRAVVVGVAKDLRLIAANLLDNAVGYNRDGGWVDVRLSRLDGAVVLEVADGGIGIAQEDLDRIFERFYRVDVARSRAAGGTGLGLSIVRHAVERQGGTISVDSILGEGSTFTITLPVEPAG